METSKRPIISACRLLQGLSLGCVKMETALRICESNGWTLKEDSKGYYYIEYGDSTKEVKDVD